MCHIDKSPRETLRSYYIGLYLQFELKFIQIHKELGKIRIFSCNPIIFSIFRVISRSVFLGSLCDVARADGQTKGYPLGNHLFGTYRRCVQAQSPIGAHPAVTAPSFNI